MKTTNQIRNSTSYQVVEQIYFEVYYYTRQQIDTTIVREIREQIENQCIS